MYYIKISQFNKSVKLKVMQDYKIKISAVQIYFENCRGLTYTDDNGDSIGVDVEKDYFILNPNVLDYQVFSSQSKEDSKFEESKKRKVNNILAIINEDACPKKVAKIVDLAEIKKVNINVGWKHFHGLKGKMKYYQMKDPIGGIKTLELDRNKEYTLDEIKELAIKVMKNDENKYYFEDSNVKLGNYQDEFFDDLTNSKGEKCSFWSFVQKNRSKNRIFRIYIFSKKREMDQNSKDSNKELLNLTSVSNLPDCKTLLRKDVSVARSIYESPAEKQLIINSSANKPINVEKSSNFASVKQNSLMFSSNNNKISIISTSNRPDKNSPVSAVKNLDLTIPLIEFNNIIMGEERLGQGGFGTVFKANWLGTSVAVKKIALRNNDKYVIREIDVMQKVRHPNIVSIMGVSIREKEIFIVMEYFNSSNLRSIIFNSETKQKFSLTEIDKNYIGFQICQAVAFLHQLSPAVIHEDIKPDNILVNISKQTKICDMGLSKFSEQPIDLATTFGCSYHGTPLYMAPEILIKFCNATLASDVWSLACVLLEIYNECDVWILPPLGGLQQLRMKHLEQQKPKLSKVPTILQYVLSSCFEHDPDKRPKASTLLDMYKCLNVG